jgi:hypothetical protein
MSEITEAERRSGYVPLAKVERLECQLEAVRDALAEAECSVFGWEYNCFDDGVEDRREQWCKRCVALAALSGETECPHKAEAEQLRNFWQEEGAKLRWQAEDAERRLGEALAAWKVVTGAFHQLVLERAPDEAIVAALDGLIDQQQALLADPSEGERRDG